MTNRLMKEGPLQGQEGPPQLWRGNHPKSLLQHRLEQATFNQQRTTTRMGRQDSRLCSNRLSSHPDLRCRRTI